MGHKSDAESMQELTSLMWNRYLKERVKEEQNHEMNAYKAEVVTNNGDGTLTVKRPFESVNLTLKAASSLQFAQPGDMVLVVGIGDKSKALSNAFILCKTDLSDDTSVPVYGLGDNMLHNWYFAGTGGGPGELPVNLRGQSSYTGSGYTIDGWYARNSMTVGVQSDGLHLSFPSGVTTLKGLNQTFTAFRNYLVGKTVTVSVLVKDFMQFGSTSYPKFGLYSGDSVGVHSSGKLTGIISGNGLFTATGTLGSDILDYSNLNFTACYANSYSGSLTVVAAKMELGSKSTLAHQENGVWVLNSCPSYNEELLKCQTATSNPNWDPYAHGVVSINTPKPNLLDNWYFVGGGSQLGEGSFPINQRGQTSYTVAGYCIDRWYSQRTTHTLTLQSDCIHWERVNNVGYNPLFYQSVKVVQGEVYTYSILYRSTFRKLRETFTATLLPEASDWTLYSTTATVSGTSANIGIQDMSINQGLDDTGKYVEIKAIKLEIGAQQTLAHWDGSAWVLNEIPDYGRELYECQRYLKQVINWSDTYAARSDTTNLYFFIPGATMARVPDPLTSQQVYFYSGSNYYTITDNVDFTRQYSGIRGSMPKGSIPNNVGGSLVFASAVYISAE